MIQSQFLTLTTAILTGILIPAEYFKLGHFPPPVRSLYEIYKPDHSRHIVIALYRMNDAAAIFNDFCLTTKNQNNGPANPTNIERHVILIKH
jgi:hypothetical protein